jgi:hypothetical protein
LAHNVIWRIIPKMFLLFLALFRSLAQDLPHMTSCSKTPNPGLLVYEWACLIDTVIPNPWNPSTEIGCKRLVFPDSPSISHLKIATRCGFPDTDTWVMTQNVSNLGVVNWVALNVPHGALLAEGDDKPRVVVLFDASLGYQYRYFTQILRVGVSEKFSTEDRNSVKAQTAEGWWLVLLLLLLIL